MRLLRMIFAGIIVSGLITVESMAKKGNVHSIDLSTLDLSIRTGHLNLGGSNPEGVRIDVNNRYLTLDGEPWLPVMGEFHFTRFPESQWRDELMKMKAGGINVVATYIFWIHHEEAQGTFDWEGRRNLKKFAKLCDEVGIYLYPRIGPWAHGECRNGGFPDWILDHKEEGTLSPRSNDKRYLKLVKRLYSEIEQQLRGMLWKDGGPIVGLQIENEYMLKGEGKGAEHLLALKHLAKEVGLDVPLYTVTGWARTEFPKHEVIPVFGGYPFGFWERDPANALLKYQRNYFMHHTRNDSLIGNDFFDTGENVDIDSISDYPFATCETGGGMTVAYHCRPRISPDDVGALSLVKAANGCNLHGYYMYHGGVNPVGKLSTLQESQISGGWNDNPEKNYDFQAPLGAYGQVNPTFYALRPINFFLQEFGAEMAPMVSVLPSVIPSSFEDGKTLRWAVRSDGKKGFLFVNNYQRSGGTRKHESVQFALNGMAGEPTVPSESVSIPVGSYFIWPINMDLGKARLIVATAQPLTRVTSDDGIPVLVLFATDGIAPVLEFEKESLKDITIKGGTVQSIGERVIAKGLTPGEQCIIEVLDAAGGRSRVLVLTEEQAKHSQLLHQNGRRHLALSKSVLLEDLSGDIKIVRTGNTDLSINVYPPLSASLTEQGKPLSASSFGIFQRFDLSAKKRALPVKTKAIREAGKAPEIVIGEAKVAQAPSPAVYDKRAAVWKIELDKASFQSEQKAFLDIDYVGDAARAYVNGKLVGDDFYNGAVWRIGLHDFLSEALTHGIEIKILPFVDTPKIFIAPKPELDFKAAEMVELRSVKAVSEYSVKIYGNR